MHHSNADGIIELCILYVYEDVHKYDNFAYVVSDDLAVRMTRMRRKRTKKRMKQVTMVTVASKCIRYYMFIDISVYKIIE